MSSISRPCFGPLRRNHQTPQVEKDPEPTVDSIVSLGDALDYRSAKVKHYELEGRGRNTPGNEETAVSCAAPEHPPAQGDDQQVFQEKTALLVCQLEIIA